MKFVLLAILWLAVVFASGWVRWVFLGFAVVASYFVIGRWWYRNSRPWKKIYFPLIDRYTPLGSFHVVLADQTGLPFTPKDPFAVILREIQPAFSDEEIEYLLDKWEDEATQCSNAPVFHRIMEERGVPAHEVPDRLNAMIESMTSEHNFNGYFVRHMIGEIIESKLGPEQKKEYWRAVLVNEVV